MKNRIEEANRIEDFVQHAYANGHISSLCVGDFVRDYPSSGDGPDVDGLLGDLDELIGWANQAKQALRDAQDASFRSSWERCAYVLWLISNGDHKALGNAKAASHEALRIMRDAGALPEWMEPEDIGDGDGDED